MVVVNNRLGRRRFEVFTTDAKIIRLIRRQRRRNGFSTAIAARLVTAWLISLPISLIVTGVHYH